MAGSKKEDAKKPATSTKKLAKAKEAEITAEDARFADMSEEDKAKVGTLLEAGVDLTGKESSEELDAKLAALEAGDVSEADEEDEDLPDEMPARFETVQIDNKPHRFFVHFLARAGKKCALYNEHGKRISPVVNADDIVEGSTPEMKWGSRLAKNAAQNNARRRSSMVPGDYAPAPRQAP